jgi:hypothetical protein
MILIVILEGISKLAIVLSVLMKVYTIPCHDRDYINVMLVLQSCADPLHIPPGSSSDTYATSSECAYHVGNLKLEEDLDVEEEEGEVNVKTEKGRGSEEEECIGIKDEEVMYGNEEEEEGKEDIDTKKEDADIKEEVSVEDAI